MSDPKNNDADGAKQLTAAEAAKRVKRTVIDKSTKDAKTKRVAVEAEEVLSFRDYGTHVVVVTTDGQKLSSADE